MKHNTQVSTSPTFHIKDRKKRTKVRFEIRACGTVFAYITVFSPPLADGKPERKACFKATLFILSRLGRKLPGYPLLSGWLREEGGGKKGKDFKAQSDARALLEGYFNDWMSSSLLNKLLEENRFSFDIDIDMVIPHYTSTQEGPIHTGWRRRGNAKVLGTDRHTATQRDLAFALYDVTLSRENRLVVAQRIAEIDPLVTNAKYWWPAEEARHFLAIESPFVERLEELTDEVS